MSSTVSTALLALAVATCFHPTIGAPYYDNTHAYGHLQKGWSHHPLVHALGHGPLSHWALSLNGHLKHGLHSLKHAALGFKHEFKHGLKHGGLLGLKHGGFTKHGDFTKHGGFDVYGGVVHHAPLQHHEYNHHALAFNAGSPLGGQLGVSSNDVIELRGHAGSPLVDHSGLASHDVIALRGHAGPPLVFPEHAVEGSDVRPAVPLSEYGNFPTEG